MYLCFWICLGLDLYYNVRYIPVRKVGTLERGFLKAILKVILELCQVRQVVRSVRFVMIFVMLPFCVFVS